MLHRRLAWCFPLIAVCLCLSLLPSCRRAPDPWQGLDDGGRKRVVVSFPPLYSFVRAVGGDHVAIICLCIHEEPHEFQPDMQKSLVFRKADLLFSNGLNLDIFADSLVKAGDNKSIRHIKLAETLPDTELLEDKNDPHAWLGTSQAIHMVNKIRDELAAIDPAHKDDYTRNAAAYVVRLEALRDDGERRLKDKSNRKLVSSHDALRYFAHTFGLSVIPIKLTPEDKPSGSKMAELIKTIGEENVRVIAIEPGGEKTRSEAEVLLANIKQPPTRHIIVFDPLETANEDELKAEGGDWYLKRMRQNLDTLIEALP